MRVSLQLIPEQPVDELLAAAQAADELGYYACYSADEIYHKDAWLLFAAVAGRTERIRLGPCVAPIYVRDPTYVAQLAATLDELSDGRAEVVFGIGNVAMLEQYGVPWRGTRPIARLREAHRVMRTLLDEGSIDFAGEFYAYSGVSTVARPVQEHLPLKIGAMGGPKSMESPARSPTGCTLRARTPRRRWDTPSGVSRRALGAPAGAAGRSILVIRCWGRLRQTARRRGRPAGSSPPSTFPRCRQPCWSATKSARKRSLPLTMPLPPAM